MICLINVNATLCRFYQYEKKQNQLILLKEFSHPEGRLKISEIIADRSGQYMARDTARGTYSPHTDVRENGINHFAKEIADELNQERNKQVYEKLIIISPPHMRGILYEHLNKHVKELIAYHIQKDLLHLKEHELLDLLKEHDQKKEW